MGDEFDPLSLNLYTYCHNEPIMYFDPTGHMWVNRETYHNVGGSLKREYTRVWVNDIQYYDKSDIGTMREDASDTVVLARMYQDKGTIEKNIIDSMDALDALGHTTSSLEAALKYRKSHPNKTIPNDPLKRMLEDDPIYKALKKDPIETNFNATMYLQDQLFGNDIIGIFDSVNPMTAISLLDGNPLYSSEVAAIKASLLKNDYYKRVWEQETSKRAVYSQQVSDSEINKMVPGANLIQAIVEANSGTDAYTGERKSKFWQYADIGAGVADIAPIGKLAAVLKVAVKGVKAGELLDDAYDATRVAGEISDGLKIDNLPLAKPGEDLYVGTYSKSTYWNRKNGLNKTHSPHHVVQDKVSGTTHGKGITINIKQDIHKLTETFGSSRTLATSRQHLAADIYELRNLLKDAGYNRSTINAQLWELIKQNKSLGGFSK